MAGGIIFGRMFSFGKHVRGILCRARIRLAVFSRLSGGSEGDYASPLGLSGKALVVTSLGYCPAVVVAGAYDQFLYFLELCVATVLDNVIL